jgi:hypothetical protein
MKTMSCSAALAFWAGMATAQTTLLCEIDARSAQGWIAPQIAFAIDGEAGRAVVSDGIILGFVGGPVEGRLVSDNAARTVVAWTVRGKDGAQQSATLEYRATIMKADNAIAVTMRPVQYDNSFRAAGQCRAG